MGKIRTKEGTNRCPNCKTEWIGRWEIGKKETICPRCGHEYKDERK
jgi:predicted Zn-ribbon and HTH transcriptional regulator